MIKLIRKFLRVIYKFKVRKKAKSVGRDLSVNGWSTVTTKTVLGNNVNFNGMKITGNGNVRIGDNFHSGTECRILTQNHNYDQGNKIPYDRSHEVKNTVIEDNVWFGIRVMILPGVHIGEGAIVQAGSVVTHDIPKYGIAGGHPAKVFSYRDQEHYEKLKAEGKFH